MKRALMGLLPFLLALSLCTTAWAVPDTVPAVGVGTDTVYGAFGSNLYMGNWKGNPILWRVLSTSGSGGTYTDTEGQAVDRGGAVFLLTANLIETDALDYKRGYPYPGFDYMDSYARKEWCPKFFNDTFDPGEQLAILYTSKTTDGAVFPAEGYSLPLTKEKSPALENDRVFVPSVEELCTEAYGFAAFSSTEDVKRSAIPLGKDSERYYHLRSELNYELVGGSVGIIYENGIGQMGPAPIMPWLTFTMYYRPATNLDAARVVLNTAVENGKPEAPGLTAVADKARDANRKLTLREEARAAFSVSEAVVTSGKAVFTYENAAVGAKEYLSALLCDGDGRVLYYGWLKALTEATDTSGTIELDVSALPLSGGNTLYVFNEQRNGGTYTDYSSSLLPLTLKYPAPEPPPSTTPPTPEPPPSTTPPTPEPPPSTTPPVPEPPPSPTPPAPERPSRHTPVKVGGTEEKTASPQTADPGVALYAVFAVASAAGAVRVARRRYE